VRLKEKLVLVLIAMYSIFSVVFTVTWLYLLADNEARTDTKIKAEFLETSYNSINNIAETYFQLFLKLDFVKANLNPNTLFINDIDGYIFFTDYSGNILNSNKQTPDEINSLVTSELISGFINEFHIKNQKKFSIDNYQEVMNDNSADTVPIKINFVVIPEHNKLLAYGQLMYSTMARVDALNTLVVRNNWTLSITGIAYLLISLSILVVTIWSFFSFIIDSPLQKIVKALQFNSRKESYAPMVSKIKDEIGDISRAIDTLQKNQNKLLNNFKQSENNLIQIIDLIPSSIFARDINGTYLIANKLAADECNTTVSELVGSNANTINKGDPEADEYLKEDRTLIKSKEATVIDKESNYETPKGIRWKRIVKMPYYPAGGDKSILCIITDISRVKFAEQELQDLNKSLESKVEDRTKLLEQSNNVLQLTLDELQVAQQELIKKEKMASLSVLTAGMSHELNTPIGVCVTAVTNITSILDELNEVYASGKLTTLKFTTFLNDMSDSTTLTTKNLDRAADLINSFKKLASNQAHSDIERFDLISLINEILLPFKGKFKKSGIQVNFEHPNTEALFVVSYVGSYTQILTNLITNSLVHSQMTDGKGEISLELYLENEKVFLSYGDNGIGVSESVSSKIFDPFYTTKRTQGGTGLGLHIVATLVENSLAGKIQCIAHQGEGLSFLIESKIHINESMDVDF